MSQARVLKDAASLRSRVELICAGSELLDGQVNTHEAHLGVRLRSIGLKLDRAGTMRDDRDAMASAIAEALGRCDALLLCGGLGPTFDDVTREAAAAALGRQLEFQPALWKDILERFARHKMKVPKENERQAFLIEGARALSNEFGSAPGQLVERPRPGRAPQLIALLPGPFSEMSPMFEGQVLPRLKAAYARGVWVEHEVFHLAGLPESAADERLSPLTERPGPGEEFTILAGKGQVDFHVRATAASRAKAAALLAKLRRRVLDAVGDNIFGEGAETLESALGDALLDRGWTLAVAESCTGGGVGQRLTRQPGSSRWFRGGVIAYDNALKTGLLGVSPETLKKRGAVSPECARELARGARRACGATLGLSLTGVAGPGGGTKDKPVGMVCIALAGPKDSDIVELTGRYGQGRDLIRERAGAAAIHLALRQARRRPRGSA